MRYDVFFQQDRPAFADLAATASTAGIYIASCQEAASLPFCPLLRPARSIARKRDRVGALRTFPELIAGRFSLFYELCCPTAQILPSASVAGSP